MKHLPLLLLLLLPLTGCLAIGPAWEAVRIGVKVGVAIVKVVDVLKADEPEPEPEDGEDLEP